MPEQPQRGFDDQANIPPLHEELNEEILLDVGGAPAPQLLVDSNASELPFGQNQARNQFEVVGSPMGPLGLPHMDMRDIRHGYAGAHHDPQSHEDHHGNYRLDMTELFGSHMPEAKRARTSSKHGAVAQPSSPAHQGTHYQQQMGLPVGKSQHTNHASPIAESEGAQTPLGSQGSPSGDRKLNVSGSPSGSAGNGDDETPESRHQRQRLGAKPLEIQKTTDIKLRACDECRRRKTACYYLKGEDEKCFRCQMEGVDCTFSDRSKSSQGRGDVGKQVPIPERAATKLPPNQDAVPVEDYSLLRGRSLLKKTLSLQHPRSSFSVGQHGLWDQRVLESIALDKSGQARVASNLSLRKVGSDSWFMVRNEAGQRDWIRECDDIEKIVYPYGRALVNVYFMHFQPEYPILHEKIFIEKYLRTYRELMPALLGVVYLIGMRYWFHSPELSTVARPDHIVPGLYDLVLANFFKASGGASLSLIQAGLLLLQCSYAESRHLSISSVINSAAFRLALNRNCLHWKLPRWEINLRLRLSWATYSQSTWISLFESIPPLIQDSSWFLTPLNSDIFDAGASSEPVQHGALFIQLNELSLIVHDIHNLLSSRLFMMYSNPTSVQQAISKNANTNLSTSLNISVGQFGMPDSPELSRNITAASPGTPGSVVGMSGGSSTAPSPYDGKSFTMEDILDLIKPIQMRLHEWFNQLPSSLTSLEGDRPTGNFSLRMAYIAAEVSLHRFMIRVLSSSVPPVSKSPEVPKLLRSTARERLDVAMDLIRQLRPQHLHQFWYFASGYQLAVIGLFAALMYTTSESKSEGEYYLSMLRDYIAQLSLYSDNDVMSSALRTLRSSIAGVPGLVF